MTTRSDYLLTKAHEICVALFKEKGMEFDLESIRKFDRRTEIVLQRRMVCTELRRQGFKFRVIGKFINRHHATVMHLINSGEKPEYSEALAKKNRLEYHIRKVKELKGEV